MSVATRFNVWPLITKAMGRIESCKPSAITSMLYDLLISFQSGSEAAQVIKDLRNLLFSCGFHLTKFVSNNAEALSTLPEDEMREGQVEVDLDCPKKEKALGVSWDPRLDEFVLGFIW